MVKKEKQSDIYESEQINRKFRKKSKKLEKREKIRKNKKKTKKERNDKGKLIKYIKKVFKENSKEIDSVRLFEHCFDLDEIEKQIKKMLSLNKDAATEIPSLFKTMEEGRKEVNLAGLEDKQVQKYLLKLMKNLKIDQNPKNPFSFRIKNLFVAKDPRKKITSDSDDIISECLSSYYFLVKAIFEYENYILSTKVEAEASKNKKEGEAKGDNSNSDDNSDGSSDEEENLNEENKIAQQNFKKLEKEKLEMDYEYELIEQKLGKNAELINKAFNKILQEDSKQSKLNAMEEEDELIGPPVPQFLASTMSLLKSFDNNDDEDVSDKNKLNTNNNIKKTDAFTTLLNKTSYTNENTKKKLPISAPKSKLEPVNKESYDRLMAYERERMKTLTDEIDDYDSKYRRTSLMEDHQNLMKKNKDKNKMSDKDMMTREFDRDKEMNVGRVDSKRALAIMRDQKGLQGRFEAKEKYIGY